MHEHSLKAYASERDRLSRREKEVLGVLHTGAKMTDRQVMQALNYTDMNSVRPRITELISDKWVAECGEIIDPLTRKPVRVVKALQFWERNKLLQEERDRANGQRDLFAA